ERELPGAHAHRLEQAELSGGQHRRHHTEHRFDDVRTDDKHGAGTTRDRAAPAAELLASLRKRRSTQNAQNPLTLFAKNVLRAPRALRCTSGSSTACSQAGCQAGVADLAKRQAARDACGKSAGPREHTGAPSGNCFAHLESWEAGARARTNHATVANGIFIGSVSRGWSASLSAGRRDDQLRAGCDYAHRIAD